MAGSLRCVTDRLSTSFVSDGMDLPLDEVDQTGNHIDLTPLRIRVIKRKSKAWNKPAPVVRPFAGPIGWKATRADTP